MFPTERESASQEKQKSCVTMTVSDHDDEPHVTMTSPRRQRDDDGETRVLLIEYKGS